MYILLVDDEPIILRGVERIILKKFPQHETATFTDPLQALASIQTRKPDLLITDQYMPELTGLELVERAAELGCRHYAILTGYDEFSLVQRALRLHAADYLTKPVNKQDLYHLVENTEKQLSQQAFMPLSDLISILRVLAFWSVNSAEFESLQLDSDPRLQAKEAAMLLFPAQNASCAEKLAQTCRCLDLGLTPFENHAVLLLDLPESKLNETVQALSGEHGAVSAAYQSPWRIEMLCSLYQRAVVRGSDDVQQFSTLLKDPSNTAGFRDELKKIINKHDGSLQDTIASLRQTIYSLGFQTTPWDLLQLISRLLDQGAAAADGAESFIASLKPKPALRSKQIIEAVAYIDTHYAEELSLPAMANQLYLQSSYFSNLFRKETGISFVKYLNRIRIENACILISQCPDVSMENLSSQAGFVNPQYFFRVFKSHTGFTPGEFRGLYQSLSDRIKTA